MARSFCGNLLIGLIGVYRAAISPLIGPRCRYVPTCSEYASQAIERHGLCCGVRLALGRIFRCHPWGGSGVDEVPEQVNPRCCTSFSLTPRTRKFH